MCHGVHGWAGRGVNNNMENKLINILTIRSLFNLGDRTNIVCDVAIPQSGEMACGDYNCAKCFLTSWEITVDAIVLIDIYRALNHGK